MEINNVLTMFGLNETESIEQIYRSAWNIDNKYILKINSDLKQLENSILLCDSLLKEGISVPEYLRTSGGEPYVQVDDGIYVLMKKINGCYHNPYNGDPYKNGVLFGNLVAELHTALKRIGDTFDCYDADYMKELDDWIMKNIKEKNVPIQQEIIDYCYGFCTLYKTLPRQLIHRDIHDANILFENWKFTGWLDFDMSQKNVRLYDICYLGATLLTENYKDEKRFSIWRKIFRGVLDGYGNVFELTENEIAAIPYMFVFIKMTFTAFYARMNEENMITNCVDMTEWLFNNKDRIAEIAKEMAK